MISLRRASVVATVLLLLGVTAISVLAQQQANPGGGTNNCGTVNCPAGCKCQITKCDKGLQPGCVDLGICVDCPAPPVLTVANVTIVTLAVAVVAAVCILIYRRRQSASGSSSGL
jgi:hypothetical protein